MPLRVTHLESPSPTDVRDLMDRIGSNGRTYGGMTAEACRELPTPLQGFVALDDRDPVGLFLLGRGFLETWGAPADLLDGNPVLPHDDTAAAIHTALLAEASAWIEREGHAGLEILLPMGAANLVRNDVLDSFYSRLGFRRHYVTLVRGLGRIPDADDLSDLDIAPAAAASLAELYRNYSETTAHGEIELVARQTPDEHRAYFDDLANETLGHPGSLAAFADDRLVGFTLVAPWGETASHLAWLGVMPEARRRGVGRRLLIEAMAASRECGSERMSLYTDVGLGAESLYESVGFEPAGALTYRWRRGEAVEN